MAVKTLFVADGEDPRARRLADLIRDAGNEVVLSGRLREAVHLATVGNYDVVVFDSTFAGPDFLPTLRRKDVTSALVGWMPGASSMHVAELLESGVHEVLHGGMGAREVVARLRNAAREPVRATSGPLELGPLRIDLAHGHATWHGTELRLTKREREVLHALASASGRVVPRETLYRRVWGYTMARGDRCVDVNVKRLRAKLASAIDDTALAIATQPGVGYRLELAQTPTSADDALAVTPL